MNIKLMMFWDIKPGLDQEYFEFVVREWVPATHKLGLQTIGAWYTVYSREENTRQIMLEALAPDLQTMKDILDSTDWLDISEQLMEYVENFSQKIVPVTGDFQL